MSEIYVNDPKLVEMTAQITKRFLATQKVEADKLPDLISGVYKSLWEAEHPTPQFEPEVRQKRSYTRRAQGQTIVDAEEAPVAMLDEVVEDTMDEMIEENEIPETENVVGSVNPNWRDDDAWDEHGQPKQAQTRPEPDFD